MEMPGVAAAVALALILIIVSLAGQCSGQLKFGFYNGKCRDGNGFQRNVEDIVRQKVKEKFSSDTTIVAALLRMQFHDCFVNGCDASILLDVPNGEKTAPPNLSVRGYEFIEDIKTEIENTCPGIVSCADIIVMATRDAVVESDINKMGTGWYPVQTGRRDGRVSSAQNVNLPSPSIPVPQAIAAFSSKKLSTIDMVYLLGGGHSVGVAHCGLFENRLYDFKNTGNPDPAMNTTLLQNPTNSLVLEILADPLKSSSVDKSFYEQIRLGNGILEVDQQLALDPNTRFPGGKNSWKQRFQLSVWSGHD
uniref:Peroxidase n=1 Tax=Salix viminalis TaxID=40686 RepID=A0A6N2MKH4_SALVM